MPAPTIDDEDQRLGDETPQDGGWHTDIDGVGGGDGGFDWGAAERDVASDTTPGNYNPLQPSSKATPKEPDLKSAEQKAGEAGADNPASKLEKEAFDTGKQLAEALESGTPVGRFAGALAVLRTRRGKAAGISGVVFTLLFVGFAFFSAGLESISVSSRFTQDGNLNQNFGISRRQGRIMGYFASKLIKIKPGGLIKNIDVMSSEKVLKSLEKNGFRTVLDGEGKLASISTDLADGSTKTLSYAAQDLDTAVARWIEDIGPGGVKRLNKVANTAVNMYKNPTSRTVNGTRLGVTSKSAVEDMQRDPEKTPEENAKQAAADSEKPQTDIDAERGVTKTDDDLTEKNEDGSTKTSADDVADVADNVEDSLDNDINKIAKPLENVADNAPAEVVSKAMQDALAKTATGSIKAGALSTIDATQWAQVTCSALGTLQWAVRAQQLYMYYELARIGYRYLNAADSQKAGIAVEGIGVYLSFFHMGRQTGAYTSAPGLGYALGNHNRKVSKSSLTQFSVGKSKSVFATISNFLNGLPGVNSDAFRGSCKFVNNGWVQAASMVVGTLAAIFTLGGSAEVSFGAQAFLLAGAQAAITLTTEIAGPLIALAGKHIVLSELKDTLSKGDALGAGLLMFAAMNGSALSFLMTSKTRSAAIRVAALNERKQLQKEKNAFERYLSISDTDSLLSKLAFSMPHTLPEVTSKATVALASALNPVSFLSRASGDVYAQAEETGSDQCVDGNLTKWATSPFCTVETSSAPELGYIDTYNLLLANNEIDQEGNIIGSDFKKFDAACASGAASLVYDMNVAKDGSDVGNDTIETCDPDAGAALNGETKTVSDAYAYIYKAQPKPSLFARMMGQRAYAAPAEARLVSKTVRYAYWKSVLVDIGAIAEDVSGDFGGGTIPTGGQQAGGGASTITAEGLNGYTIPCTGLPSTVKKVGARPDAIDWTGIPDSGTIGVASDGAPIKVFIREPCDTNNAKTVIIASSIHGTENEGQDISFQLLFNKSLPANMRVIAIPEVNHAGIYNNPGRINANGVNLNRNFGFNWKPIAKSSENNYSGPSADSEPETKAIEAFLRSVPNNNLLISYHDNIHYIVASNNLGLPASKAYFNFVTARGVGGFSNIGGEQNSAVVPQSGGLDAWYGNTMNKPAMLIELKATTPDSEVSIHADAIISLVQSGTLQ